MVGAAIINNPRFVGFEDFRSFESFHHTRLEAWRSSYEVMKENFFLGVGIGDSENLLIERHLERGYVEGYQNQYNEHNQYMQVTNACGVVGLAIFLLSLLIGFRKAIRGQNYLQFAFIFSLAFVCLVENILVRRAGIIYFAFFYCLLFIPSYPHEDD
jgi:O-antigen ligase